MSFVQILLGVVAAMVVVAFAVNAILTGQDIPNGMLTALSWIIGGIFAGHTIQQGAKEYQANRDRKDKADQRRQQQQKESVEEVRDD